MSIEATSVLGILVICWITVIMADAAICGLAHLAIGISFKKSFLWGLIALLLPPVVMGYGAFIERNIYKVNEIEMEFDSLPESFDGYRIVHISDIHARSFSGRQQSLQKAVDKINSLTPDMIAVTGDLMTMAPGEIDAIADQLKGLKAADGVFSVLGNHDYGIYAHGEDNPEQMTKDSMKSRLITKERLLGWELLLNENRMICRDSDSMAVIGVENTSASTHFPSKGNLRKASEGTEGAFRILLSHDPTHWDMEVIGQDYPLTLSGHTHAMQFSLFGWSPSRYIFKQYRGHYEKDGQHLYVNTGLGETIIPIRIGTPPEITLIILKSK